MRYHDWPEKMHDVIRAAKRIEFEWGKHDCLLFSMDCVEAMTGVDHVKKLRGKYETEIGVLRAFRKIENVRTLPELIDKYFGDRVEATGARRGDLVLASVDSVEALGIVAGRNAIFLCKTGIRTVPLKECSCTWRVN